MRKPRSIPTSSLIAEVLRVAPDLDELESQLNETPQELVDRALARRGGRARPVGDVDSEAVEAALGDPVRTAVEKTVASSQSAVRKIKEHGEDAPLTPDEIAGTEAIILLLGRPAILIQDGRFFPPPKPWQKLDDVREAIETTIQSVGRIEVRGHPALEWVGTGFVVSDDVVMTNRHVAKEFARRSGRGWSFEPGMKAQIDFAEEFGGGTPEEFPLTEVIGIHDDFDLALLRVAKRSGRRKLPKPLPLSAERPKPKRGQEIYVIGYPASDSRRNDPEEMMRIFASIFNVKRLQPGKIRSLADRQSLFAHDCSTLGGNSGSCVLDLATNQVIGLHFQGRYLEANWAVALWKLTNDRLLKKADLQFVG